MKTEMLPIRKLFSAFVLTCLFFSVAFSQGVTSANILGLVTDTGGEPLAGATVVAKHLPSGSIYGVTTREDGRFNLPNVRIGGPYEITANYIGYREWKAENINLSLGQNFRIDIQMTEDVVSLGEVVITTEKSEILNSERTGAATNISEEVMATMPTFSRGLNDFIRLTPQSRSSSVAATTGSGTSFAGQDSRFNNLTIDGSIFNNSFGLASAPAGQTNSTPISLDALEEIQVSIAPYDVRQGGFTGAGINAVTRSGTNRIEGSVFYNTRNEKLLGKKAAGTDVVTNDFNVKQYGFRLGGPIKKDKLFFFVNGEIENRSDPATSWLAARPGLEGTNVTRVSAADLDALSAFLVNKFDYDPGRYENYPLETYSAKALAKLDYNINQSNRFSLRLNYLKSYRDVLASNSGSYSDRSNNAFALNFENSNYVINNNIFSAIAELNTIIKSDLSNRVQFGFTANRDFRSSRGGIFPLVDILQGGRNYTTFGYEPFTPNNILNTDTWQFQDNLTLYKGNHTLTAGLNFESFKFDNTFTPTYYGQFVFNSLDDFYASANGNDTISLARYQLTYSALENNALPTATTKVYQPGFYLQDEMSLMGDKLKITIGARVDVPIYAQTALKNTQVDTLIFKDENGDPVQYMTDKLPDTKAMFSPRVGFNYDVMGNRSFQIRGGTGIFSGRPAFVWISNQVGNNGILTGSIRVDNTKDYPFNPNVEAYIPENATTPSSYNIAVTDNDFRFPQLWRSNIGVDVKLFAGFVGTLEGIYSTNLNNVYYINANLEPTTGNFAGPDNRPIYPGLDSASSVQNKLNRVNDFITDAVVLKNTKKGYNYSLTAKIERQFEKGFYVMAAYNFSESKDLMTAGSIAFSSWRDNKTVNGNNLPDQAFSDFDQRHRFIGALSYRAEYFKFGATTVSLFMQSGNQGRYSYNYVNDQNGDQIQGNDLLYIPNDASELNFEQYSVVKAPGDTVIFSAQQQSDAFNQFIDNDDYLSANKGKYSERNGVLLPWLTTVDFSLQQEFMLTVGDRKHKLQFRADVFNFMNLFNNAWGVGDIPVTTAPLRYRSRNAEGEPVYRYDNLKNFTLPTEPLQNRASLSDVWQLQLGVRYIFD